MKLLPHIEEQFPQPVFKLLQHFATYLLTSSYAFSQDGRIKAFAILYKVAKFIRSWESAAEKDINSMSDTVTIVSLFELFRDSEKWFHEYKSKHPKYTLRDHLHLCLYVMYSLYGQCTGYPTNVFSVGTFFKNGAGLVGCAVELLTKIETDYINFCHHYQNTLQVLKSYPASRRVPVNVFHHSARQHHCG